ncbi:hypothetical protein GCM10023091_10790 [Ravibacter arvi]|uniref:YD repeat-containing protein n=1 Tax=Ravibacter arvi TaxID=2051041 RepID=A0ABP8LT96_9BACT
MKTKLLFVVLCCADFVACKNNFDAIFSIEGEKLGEVYYGNTKTQEFKYDNHGRLITDESKYSYYSYTYLSGKRRIVKKIYTDPGFLSSSSTIVNQTLNRKEWVNPLNTPQYAELRYEFDSGNRLVRSEEVTGYSEYEYGADGRIAVRKLYHNGAVTGMHKYSYDVRGNLIRREQYSGGSVSSVTEYQYDEMKSPYFGLIPDRLPGYNTSPNNIIHEKYTVYNYPKAGDESVLTNIALSYQYNSLGYPTERNDGVRFTYLK